jgi:branched-chain amino acid transport system substrate-binding protein
VTVVKRCLALIGAVLLSFAPAAAQPQPVTIDVIINNTGSNAFVGESYSTALRVLEQLVNKTGGIQGRPLHFEFHDDGSSVSQSVQIATQLIAKHPAVVIGPAASGTCAAVAPLFVNGPVDFCLSTAYAPVPRGYVFASATQVQTYVGPASIRYMRLRGYKRLAVIDATDATGQASDKMMQYVLSLPESAGLQYVAWEHFSPTDISIAAQAQRMLAAHPDAVVTFAGGTEFGTVLRGIYDAGLKVPVFASGANLDAAQLTSYKAFLPPAMYFNSFLFFGRDALPAGKLRDNVDQMYAAYKAAGQKVSPSSGFGWDPGWVVVNALRKLGPNATADQLHTYLEGLHDFAGVDGIYDFPRTADNHGLTDLSVIIVTWNPDKADFTVVSKPGGYPLK